MARISKNWICYGYEGRDETGVNSHGNVCNGEAHACTNHADDTGDEDAQDARDRKPGKAVKGARESADQGRDGEDARIEHEAEFTIGERAEGDLAGKELASGGEDGEDDGAEGENFTADGAEEDEACVAHVVYWEVLVLRNRIFEKALAKVYEACFLPRRCWVGNGNGTPPIPSGCLSLN